MTGVIIAILIPLLGTTIGSAFVFLMRNAMPPLLQKTLLGFASGVMVAASIWSLILPSMEMASTWGLAGDAATGEAVGSAIPALRVVPAAVGIIAGMGFLLLIDTLTPHLHVGAKRPEGLHAHLSRTAMLSLAVTIHNFPEGMAVGVVIAGALQDGALISPMAAMAMSIGIAIQNIPEGAIISMPMRAAGGSRLKAFVMGTLSGVVEPIGSVLVILLASMLEPLLPYMLAFAAGAMLYVVVEELIPEASQGRHSNLSTIGFGIGFILMMVLDVVLG